MPAAVQERAFVLIGEHLFVSLSQGNAQVFGLTLTQQPLDAHLESAAAGLTSRFSAAKKAEKERQRLVSVL